MFRACALQGARSVRCDICQEITPTSNASPDVNKIVVTRGYLYKKGDGPFMWQRRFFELRPASGGSPAELCYKETEEVYQPA